MTCATFVGLQLLVAVLLVDCSSKRPEQVQHAHDHIYLAAPVATNFGGFALSAKSNPLMNASFKIFSIFA